MEKATHKAVARNALINTLHVNHVICQEYLEVVGIAYYLGRMQVTFPLWHLQPHFHAVAG